MVSIDNIIIRICYASISVALTGWGCVLIVAEGLMGPSLGDVFHCLLVKYFVVSVVLGISAGLFLARNKYNLLILASLGVLPFLLSINLLLGAIYYLSFTSLKSLFLPVLVFIFPYSSFILCGFVRDKVLSGKLK